MVTTTIPSQFNSLRFFLLECDVVQLDRLISMFRNNVLLPSSVRRMDVQQIIVYHIKKHYIPEINLSLHLRNPQTSKLSEPQVSQLIPVHIRISWERQFSFKFIPPQRSQGIKLLDMCTGKFGRNMCAVTLRHVLWLPLWRKLSATHRVNIYDSLNGDFYNLLGRFLCDYSGTFRTPAEKHYDLQNGAVNTQTVTPIHLQHYKNHSGRVRYPYTTRGADFLKP
jgi:hypothetical protein